MSDEERRTDAPTTPSGADAPGDAPGDASGGAWPGQPAWQGEPGWPPAGAPDASWPPPADTQAWPAHATAPWPQPAQPQWTGSARDAVQAARPAAAPGPAWPAGPRRAELRPLGGYADYISWFYRHRGLRLIAISLLASIPSLIVAVPVALVSSEMLRRQRDLFLDPFGTALPGPDILRQLEELNRPLFAIGAIATVISTLSFVAVTAAIAWFVTEVEAGQTPSIAGALDAIVDRLPAVTGLWVVFAGFLLLGQVFGYLASAGSLLLFSDTGRAAMLVLIGFLGFLAWIVVALFVAVRWMLAVPAAVVDNATTRRALSRSWEWTQGNAWKLLAFLLVAALAAVLVALVPLVLAGMLLVPASLSGPSPLVVASAALNWVASGLIIPLFAILAVRVYLDLRGQLAT